MKTFGVTCTIIYNGYKEIQAENQEEAINKIQDQLYSSFGKDDFPTSGFFGDVYFQWGEATADYADEQ